jgi:hypothetical protein
MRPVILACTIAAFCALAAPTTDQFLGTWKEDLSKSKNNWGDKFSTPRVRTYTANTDGGYDVKIDAVDENGKPTSNTLHSVPGTERALTPDNIPKPIRMMEATHVMVRRIDDRTTVATYRKDGKDVGTSTSKISADGKTLTMTLDGTAASGQKLTAISVYHKQ